MQSTRQVFRIVAALASALWLGTAGAQELVVWHDLGDNGTQWFERLGAEFAKQKPGVTVKASSFPTDQWFGRVISALNTDTAPDLIYNNYERVIRIQTQTNKVSDLKGAGRQDDGQGLSAGRRLSRRHLRREDDHHPDPARADGSRRPQELAREDRRESSPRRGKTFSASP